MRRLVSWSSWMARRAERGASLVEYALLLALIAIVCVTAVQFLGDSSAASYFRVECV